MNKHLACRIGISVFATTITALILYYIINSGYMVDIITNTIYNVVTMVLQLNWWLILELILTVFACYFVIITWFIVMGENCPYEKIATIVKKYDGAIFAMYISTLVFWFVFLLFYWLMLENWKEKLEVIPTIDIWVWLIPGLLTLTILFFESRLSKIVCRWLK